MIIAYISIMNEHLLDIVINSGSFKNEPVNLTKMVTSTHRKGIYNLLSNFIKNSLHNLSDLRNMFYNDAFEGLKLSQSEFYSLKVSSFHSFCDVIINFLCINYERQLNMEHLAYMNKFLEQSQGNNMMNLQGIFSFLIS